MSKSILTILLLIVFQIYGYTQINKEDTVLQKILNSIPKEEQDSFVNDYNNMSDQQKKSTLEWIEVFASMPKSSKKELIQNIDTNYKAVWDLKFFYEKLIPTNYSIYIEFKPADKLLKLGESIDIWVTKKGILQKSGKEIAYTEPVFQEWDVELGSTKLDSLLKLTPLTKKDLQEIQSHLKKANCISISNENVTEIGYARSGMGKYSYLLFNSNLTDNEKQEYNNGCEYIFYKNNIVLVYEGGAIGSQCFPD